MKTYAGIDLHSRNNYIVVIDEQDTRLFQKRMPNEIGTVVSALEPFKSSLDAVVVESTYNSGTGWSMALWTEDTKSIWRIRRRTSSTKG